MKRFALQCVGNSCGPLTPPESHVAGLTAGRRSRERETLSRVAEQEKSSVQTQLVAASTDALALKTVPFALNECLRLTTLSCYLPCKKNPPKSPETGDSEVSDESISRCHSAAPHQLLTMCSRAPLCRRRMERRRG